MKTLNRKQKAFDVFIARELSQFERVAMKADDITQKIERAVYRANSISDRDRDRDRDRDESRK